jgi:hypothetical protein
VTALSERIIKVVSTTAFRLTAAAAIALVLAAAIVTVLLFRQTNSILTEQVLAGNRGARRSVEPSRRHRALLFDRSARRQARRQSQ